MIQIPTKLLIGPTCKESDMAYFAIRDWRLPTFENRVMVNETLVSGFSKF